MSHPNAMKFKIILAFCAIYLIWGSTYLGMKYSVETLPPLLLSGSRFALAGFILYLWSRLIGGARPSRVELREAIITGILLVPCGNAVGTTVVQYLDSSFVALIYSTVPLFMFLLTLHHHKRDRVFAVKIAGIIFGFAGIYLLLSPHQASWRPVQIVCAFVTLISSALWAYASVRIRNIKVHDPFTFTACQMLAGGVVVLLLAFIQGDHTTFHFSQASTKSLLAFTYLIVFGSLIGFSSYNFLIRHVEIGKVSTYAYINPVIAVFLGVTLNHEHLPIHSLIGAIIVIIAVFTVVSAGSPKSNRSFLLLFKKEGTIAGE